jgi:hypothetical protein
MADYLFVVGDGYVRGVPGYAGFLRPGISLSIGSSFPVSEGREIAKGILQWADQDGTVWAWDIVTDRRTCVWKPGRRRTAESVPSIRQTLEKLYPELDLEQLRLFPSSNFRRNKSRGTAPSGGHRDHSALPAVGKLRTWFSSGSGRSA